ncbi:MAG: TIGR03619 family F420-dependent LLM class oxidoreductase [Gemmatimonas sp.]|nr:TIGR03619 family F420-dependent LLM class oxidoreductase [Gemmatimonas sp.]
MKVGVIVPWLGRGTLELSRQIEVLGFDSVWTGEHIVGHVPEPEALTAFAGFAAVTDRITVGTSILVMPLRHPVPTAKAVTTVDGFAQGRVVLGVGAGGDFAREFEACQVPLRERGARLDEGMDALRLLWSGKDASFSGRHFKFQEVRLDVEAHQSGGPPLWVGGRSDKAIERAATRGDGFIPYMYDGTRYRRARDTILDHRNQGGRAGDPFTFALCVHGFVAPTVEKAEVVASRVLGERYGMQSGPFVRRYGLLGTIDHRVATLEEFSTAGVEHVVLDHADDRVEVFGEFLQVFAERLDPLHKLQASG